MDYEEPDDWWQDDPDAELEEGEDGEPLPSSRSPSRYAPSEAGSDRGGPSGMPPPQPAPRSQANSEPPPVFDSAPRPARGGQARRAGDAQQQHFENASAAHERFVNQQQANIPGWSQEIMGDWAGTDRKCMPPAFTVKDEVNSVWAPLYSGGRSLFAEGAEPASARDAVVHGMIHWHPNDATRICNYETQNDPAEKARQVAGACVLGMVTMGTAKGLFTGIPSEMTKAGLDPGDGQAYWNQRKKMEASGLKTYTHCPFKDSTDPEHANMKTHVAMSMGWRFEWVYDADPVEGGKRIAYRIWHSSYQHEFSLDELMAGVMRENEEIKRSGQTNAMSEIHRSSKMVAANKSHRVLVDADNLEQSAPMQYKTISNLEEWWHALKVYGGRSDSEEGSPLYGDPERDLPAGVAVNPLAAHPVQGGQHPLGPCVALNAKRRHDNADEPHRGCNVLTAGILVNGRRAQIWEKQTKWENYYVTEDGPDKGRFRPLPELQEHIWVCTKSSVNNIFTAPFPTPICATADPSDALLQMVWDLDKDLPNTALAIARAAGKHTWEAAREETIAHFFHVIQESGADVAFAEAQQGGLLTHDTVDKTQAEEMKLNMRAYSGRSGNINKSDNWSIEPEQVIRDIAAEVNNAHVIVERWNERESARIMKLRNESNDRLDAAADEADEEVQNNAQQDHATEQADLDASDARRAQMHVDAVDAVIRMGLGRMKNAFASKRQSETIPPGWNDVGHRGLHDAMRETTKLRTTDYQVNADTAESRVGTPNLAFQYGIGRTVQDLSCFGEWRFWLFKLFSRDCCIAGTELSTMLEIYTHAVCITTRTL